MRTLRWLLVDMICLLVAAPTAGAQAANGGDDTFGDVLRLIVGPNWNLFAHTGVSTHGRFMLQRPTGAGSGERALRSEDAFTVGVGVGGDFLLRQGFRIGYAYTTSDLAFRTDNGDGSDGLDLDDGGTLHSHLIAAELIRYVLPARASFTPYGTVGLLGAWWVLDAEPGLVTTEGGSTQFRLGALATFGMQARVSDVLSARVELASATVRNPFTGSDSFRALGGTTIDEPTRVTKNDFRLVGIYYLGKPGGSSRTADGRDRMR